jgi:hypothetical protein
MHICPAIGIQLATRPREVFQMAAGLDALTSNKTPVSRVSRPFPIHQRDGE